MFSSILYNKIYSRLHLRLFPKSLLFELTRRFQNRFCFLICRYGSIEQRSGGILSRLMAVSSCAMSCWLLRRGAEWGWRRRESGTPTLMKGRWKWDPRELLTESKFTEIPKCWGTGWNFSIMLYFITVLERLCVFVCVCMCMYVQCLQKPEKGVRSHWPDLTSSREPFYVGAGSWSWVLCKSSMSSWLPSHLSSYIYGTCFWKTSPPSVRILLIALFLASCSQHSGEGQRGQDMRRERGLAGWLKNHVFPNTLEEGMTRGSWQWGTLRLRNDTILLVWVG